MLVISRAVGGHPLERERPVGRRARRDRVAGHVDRVVARDQVEDGLVDADVGLDAGHDPVGAAGRLERLVEGLHPAGREAQLLDHRRALGQPLGQLGHRLAEALRVLDAHQHRAAEDAEALGQDAAVGDDRSKPSITGRNASCTSTRISPVDSRLQEPGVPRAYASPCDLPSRDREVDPAVQLLAEPGRVSRLALEAALADRRRRPPGRSARRRPTAPSASVGTGSPSGRGGVAAHAPHQQLERDVAGAHQVACCRPRRRSPGR